MSIAGPLHFSPSPHHPLHPSLRTLLTPADETLDRLVLGQAELVVQLGGVAIALLGALPEFTCVAGAGEEGAILLAFVLEDGHALSHHLIGAQGDGHLDFVRAPLLPRAAIDPEIAMG